jgi:hypothetical protein
VLLSCGGRLAIGRGGTPIRVSADGVQRLLDDRDLFIEGIPLSR